MPSKSSRSVIAEVAARVLLSPEPIRRDLVLTGPEPLGYADVAAVLSDVLARPVRHESVTTAELEQLLKRNMPAPAAAMLAALDELLAHGAEDRTTDTVERIIGRVPRSLREALRMDFAA